MRSSDVEPRPARWRMIGSSRRRATGAGVRAAARRSADRLVAAIAAECSRSKPSVVSATFQPSPDGAEAQAVGHAHVVEEHLVERRAAAHLPDRPNLDARRVASGR